MSETAITGQQINHPTSVEAFVPVFSTEQAQYAGVMAISTELDLSITETDSTLNTSEELSLSIKEWVDQALDSCEFEATPEIAGAIEGFYTDHLTLEAAITAVAKNDFTNTVFDKILELDGYEAWEKQLGLGQAFYKNANGEFDPSAAANAKTYALRIANFVRNSPALTEGSTPERLRVLRLCGTAMEALFSESSVGVSTLQQADIDQVSLLAETLIMQAGTDVISDVNPTRISHFPTGKKVATDIREAQNTFWSDTRHAGQLLFHGSGDIGGINLHGLMSRNEQLRNTGKMNHGTQRNGGDTMHSVVPHFSEFYGMGQYASGERGGTLAVPLIKVIKEAPYARDAKYAAVQLKDKNSKKVPEPTLLKPIGSVSAGRDDRAGEIGFDRVFFASADETSDTLPDQYAVSLFDKFNKPATYIVDRTDYTANEAVLSGLGVGHGFPERAIIERTSDGIMSNDDREVASVEVIKNLQQEYFNAYNKYGVVVPLRRGVFAQAFENMDYTKVNGRPYANIYNKYTYGTGNVA